MSEKRRNKRIVLLSAVILFALSVLCFRLFAGEEALSGSWSDKISYSGIFAVRNRSEIQGLKIEFIDVGQGDSALIICGDKCMLVDTGDREYYQILRNHLESYGIRRLDYVIATHPHADHIGSMDEIINNYEIGTFITSEINDDMIPETETYESMMNALAEKDVTVKYVKTGDSFSLGNATFDILGPCGDFENINNMSVVFMLKYGDKRFLFTGDIEEEGEEAILSSGADIKCNLLKVAHNGSDTSTSEKFLSEADPDIAVISVGENNVYGHPKKKVIKRLLENDITVYRTDYDGTVSFSVLSEKSVIVGE